MRGRPLGSKDRHGKAARFDIRSERAYLTAVGSRIRDRRVELDISVNELAHATGLNQGNLHRIERGERSLFISTLCRIAVALRLYPSELIP